MAPDIRTPSWRGVIITAMVAAVLLVFVYASAVGTVFIGLLLILGVGAVVYYVGVRIDQWARHGGYRRRESE